MPVPPNPTIDQIVREGLIRGGIINPTTEQLNDGKEYLFREVKSDIALVAHDHPFLSERVNLFLSPYQASYTISGDVKHVALLDAPDTFRGVATGGSPTTITLASSFSADPTFLKGKMIAIVGGPGSGSLAYITDYNDTTKVATIDTTWSAASGSKYVIALSLQRLWPIETYDQWPTPPIPYKGNASTPLTVTVKGRTLWFTPIPDKEYVLLTDFYHHLDLVDDTSTFFTHLLRDWRSIWVYGVAVKAMERFDLDKANLKHGPKFQSLNYLQGVYRTLLAELSAEATRVEQVNYSNL